MDDDSSSSYFQSQSSRSIHATDRYFAYKLEYNKKNDKPNKKLKITIISQTVLNGWLPNFLSNYMVCNVLIDYISTIITTIQKRKSKTIKSDNYNEHEQMINQLKLNDL